jgi:hypothetical protein
VLLPAAAAFAVDADASEASDAKHNSARNAGAMAKRQRRTRRWTKRAMTQ